MGTAKKELLSEFQASEVFQGFRQGFIFKLGLKGLGYYEDASVSELEAKAVRKAEDERRAALAERKAAAQSNPEELELDLDLDDDDEDGGAAPSASSAGPPPARASNFNPEEIELDFEDLEQAPIPSEVFGGSLSKVREAVVAEEPAEEEPPMADEAPCQQESQKRTGALARFQRKGKGK